MGVIEWLLKRLRSLEEKVEQQAREIADLREQVRRAAQQTRNMGR